MERPTSADSKTTGQSIAGPTHTRKASVKITRRPLECSVLSLFVTNLRLLNLDLLPDCPNITLSTLSNQDTRVRLRCTEYALYQLFKLYDPATTVEKLQPFFPPLEPLQSVNLRAALFRCLNTLKKAGVLSKDTVLRKSMLDDCSADKFWDVCLNFSAIVLRKTQLERKSKRGKSIAERLATAQTLSTNQRESLLPLAVAHKTALSRVLAAKRQNGETCNQLYGFLSEKERQLKQRTVASQQQAQKPKALKPEKVKAVEQAIEKSWVGSVELKDALINGDTCAKGDGLLLDSFDHVWQQHGERGSIVSNGAEVGLLQDLCSRATQQSVRLSMWQNYHDRLLGAKTSSPQTTQGSRSRETTIRLNRHHDVNLKPSSSSTGETPQHKVVSHRSASRYDEILTAMREELRKHSGLRSQSDLYKPSPQFLKRAQTQPVLVRNRSLDLDASPGASDLHSRSPSQTAVPVGSRLGRRVTSQVKSYEKPKVDGQREHIPLKAEVFSPLKENRLSNTSLASSPSVLASALDGSEPLDSDNIVPDDTRPTEPVEVLPFGKAGPRTPEDRQYNGEEASTRTSRAFTNKEIEDSKVSHIEFKVPAIPEKKVRGHSNVARPSLSERTRMSIAFNSSEDVSGLLPEPTQADLINGGASEQFTSLAGQQPTFARRSSLLDRTRESISMAPTLQTSPKSKKSVHNRTRSSIYPVNQFETPRKARSSTIGVDIGKRDATPIEQLLSPDAEYDSVFKSRPRIAVSPVMSPQSDAGIKETNALGSDVVTSSPLLGIGGKT